MLRTVYHKLRDICRWLRPMQISIHSAYTSFFLILSLFPCMLLLLGLLKYTPLEVSDLLAFLEGMLPASLLPVARWLVETSYAHSSGAVISVSAIAALWSASRGMYGLINGLNAVYGCSGSRGYFFRRAISMVYTVLFLLLLLVTLVVYVFANTLVDYLWMTTQPGIMLLLSLIDLRFVLLFLLQSALFTGMYAFVPLQRHRLLQSLPGGTLAALGWLASSELFSVYMQYFTGYTNIFGSVYSLALGMLWLYFCISMLLYGGAWNRFRAEKKGIF